jgi:hypothetical protein
MRLKKEMDKGNRMKNGAKTPLLAGPAGLDDFE